jgi:hypothetical protein
MKITWQIKNRLRMLGSACALAWLSAISLSAEEPYVHWAKAVAVGSIAVTGDGGLVAYSWDGAIRKISPQGELVNSNSMAGVALHGFTTDALGNQYFVGTVYTNGTFDFPAVQGFFVAKFGPTNNLLWVRNNELPEDSDNQTTPYSISVDSQGNFAVGGNTKGRLKLGSFESDGEEGPFFCKYDAGGNLFWARKVASQHTGPFSGGSFFDIALDGSGNVIACGFLRAGSADFGGTIVYPGTTGYSDGGDDFIAKYSPNGELLWVTLDYGRSLAVDKHGDIYIAFVWPMQGVIGIAKLNGNGDLLWQKELPVALWGKIVLDVQGQPVFTGEFDGTVTFDAITLRSKGNSDFFVAKADVDGNILWAIAGGTSGSWSYDQSGEVICDSAGSIFLTASGDGTSPGSFDGITILTNSQMVARISERPPVKLAVSAGSTTLSWPAKATNYVMETATSLAPGSAWTPVLTPPTTVGRQRTVPVDTTAPAQFFRLHKP